MLEFFIQETAFWRTRNQPSGAPGAEAPITGYGGTNAAEDLGETLMYFVEDPTSLSARCPARFGFVRTHLKDHVSPSHIAAAEASAGLPPGGVAPPAPVAPGGAPGANDLTQAIVGAKAALKPAPAPAPRDPTVLTAHALVLALAKITGHPPATQFLLTSEIDEEWEDDAEPALVGPGEGA
jgi:hypothetical protein